jgi:hypothetical protein
MAPKMADVKDGNDGKHTPIMRVNGVPCSSFDNMLETMDVQSGFMDKHDQENLFDQKQRLPELFLACYKARKNARIAAEVRRYRGGKMVSVGSEEFHIKEVSRVSIKSLSGKIRLRVKVMEKGRLIFYWNQRRERMIGYVTDEDIVSVYEIKRVL